jgi:hypothetical protein
MSIASDDTLGMDPRFSKHPEVQGPELHIFDTGGYRQRWHQNPIPAQQRYHPCRVRPQWIAPFPFGSRGRRQRWAQLGDQWPTSDKLRKGFVIQPLQTALFYVEGLGFEKPPRRVVESSASVAPSIRADCPPPILRVPPRTSAICLFDLDRNPDAVPASITDLVTAFCNKSSPGLTRRQPLDHSSQRPDVVLFIAYGLIDGIIVPVHFTILRVSHVKLNLFELLFTFRQFFGKLSAGPLNQLMNIETSRFLGERLTAAQLPHNRSPQSTSNDFESPARNPPFTE